MFFIDQSDSITRGDVVLALRKWNLVEDFREDARVSQRKMPVNHSDIRAAIGDGLGRFAVVNQLTEKHIAPGARRSRMEFSARPAAVASPSRGRR